MKYCGWAGSALLGVAALPQLYKVLTEGHARGMAWGYVLLLWGGFLAMSVFTHGTKAARQLRFSYTLQLAVFTIIIAVKLWGGP